MNYEVEQTILREVLTNEAFMRKVVPYLKVEYFQGAYRTVFKQLVRYVGRYSRLPTLESVKIEIDDAGLTDEEYAEAVSVLPDLFTRETTDQEWLLEKAEQWCQDRAIHIAILEAINIIDGKSEKNTKGAIPNLLTDALSVTFNTAIGHDYFEDYEARYDFYHADDVRVPYDIELLNKITNGGMANKTLTVVMAPSGSGKSLFMCHVAAASLLMGYDVLYVTLEMSEMETSRRIDANLLDVPIGSIPTLGKDEFSEKVRSLRAKTTGKLIVQEYPAGQANANHIRALINELKIKKGFVPKLVVVDYLNLCSSARFKVMGGSVNSYSYVKAVGEEIRALAQEFGVPFLTASQLNRGGMNNSDPELENTSESIGTVFTADVMYALVSNEEFEKDGQVMVKQLKNRYNSLGYYRRFVVGIDRAKMRLFDLDDGIQKELVPERREATTDELKLGTKKLENVQNIVF